MHQTSFLKAQEFFNAYVQPKVDQRGPLRVLDIGSKVYGGHPSYGDIFRNSKVEYVGLDLEEGANVNIVPGNSFIWSEIESESFDYCISGQTFEHNPFFWVTFAEVARVLKPGGMALIIAPGRGRVHRFPVDCWRFYPDAWQSLCIYTGLELVESLFEDYEFRRVDQGAHWCDSSVIARKPCFETDRERDAFYNQLRLIVATLPANQALALEQKNVNSEAFSGYLAKSEMTTLQALRKRLSPRELYQRIFRFLAH